MKDNFATVFVRENKVVTKVRISSDSKPDIDANVIEKWQSILDLTSSLINIPAALIMKLNSENIEVFLRSYNPDNPYHPNEKAELGCGLYCENVIGTQRTLIVENAAENDIWNKNNPDIDLNMISYLGFPLNWPDGEVFGTVCILDNKANSYNDDIENYLHKIKLSIETDLALICKNQELMRKNEELQSLLTLKNKFISLIAHDIRNPLSSFSSILELLTDDFDSISRDELLEIFNSIKLTNSNIQITLDNLLEWSKKELISLHPTLSEFDLIDLINNVIKFFKYNLSIKRIEIIKDFDLNQIPVIADKNMLETAFRNILSNSIKFSNPEGKIVIRIKKLINKIDIKIIDEGMGISSEHLENLFNHHLSQKNTGTIGEKSTGIGLMLTKEFLNKNNADIFITSEVNKGTIVEVILFC